MKNKVQISSMERPMYRNLLVNVPTERSPRPVIDGAISLAIRCKASLDAIAAGYESAAIPLVAEGGAAVAAIFEAEREKAIERANAALAVFEAEATRAGLTHSSRAIGALQGEAAAILGATSRLYDLTIVPQPEFAHNTFDNTLAQEILYQSGGPVLFIPYTFKGEFQAKRVGICWDGSRLAARAVRDDPALQGVIPHLLDEANSIAQSCCPGVKRVSRTGPAPLHKPSILQDYELGRAMEIDALVRGPAAFARAANLSTPMMDLMGALAIQHARDKGLYAP